MTKTILICSYTFTMYKDINLKMYCQIIKKSIFQKINLFVREN